MITLEDIAEKLDSLKAPNKYLTIDEASEEVRMGKTAFRKYVLESGLPVLRVGSKIIIERETLYDFMKMFEV